MKTGSKYGDKHERIIRAAADVFAEKGFHPAKVEEIAERAGVGKGTVYEYFNNKQELFSEMLKDVCEQFLRILQREASAACGTRDKIKLLLISNLEILRERRNLAQIFWYTHFPLGDNELKFWFHSKMLEYQEDLVNIVREGVQNGEVNPEIDPQVASQMILGTLFTTSHKAIQDKTDNIAELVEKLVRILWQGLQNN